MFFVFAGQSLAAGWPLFYLWIFAEDLDYPNAGLCRAKVQQEVTQTNDIFYGALANRKRERDRPKAKLKAKLNLGHENKKKIN